MEAALVLAFQKNLTAYDACYAVLARQLNIPLITADKPMIKAVEWAVWLGDFK
jgi:predicted nucleic acid-binding protein